MINGELVVPARLADNGWLEPDKANLLTRLLKKYVNEDGKVEITVKPIEQKRTSAQNRYYWGVIVLRIMMFWKETQGQPISRERVHAINLSLMKMEPKLERMLVPNGRGTLVEREIFVSTFKTTSQMNTKEFSHFVDTLAVYWNELGCYWEEPKQANYITEYLQG